MGEIVRLGLGEWEWEEERERSVLFARVLAKRRRLLQAKTTSFWFRTGTERPVRNRGNPVGIQSDFPVLTGIFTGTKTSPFCPGFASGTERNLQH